MQVLQTTNMRLRKRFSQIQTHLQGKMRFFARDLVEKIGLDALLAAMNTASDNLTDVDREIVDVLQLIKQ